MGQSATCIDESERRTSQLENVKDDILGFIEEYRLMGFTISKKMIVFQATRLKKDDGARLLVRLLYEGMQE